MGKVNKRRALKHSNHHDNPHRAKNAIVRRQHSQNGSNKLGTKVKNKPEPAKPKPGSKNGVQPAKVTVPFQSIDRVLLLGEGDFSFALSLASNYTVSSCVATSFDSKHVLEQKYPQVKRTIQKLVGTESQADSTAAKSELISVEDDGGDVWNGFLSAPQSEDEKDDDKKGSQDIHLRASRANLTVLYGIDATKLSTAHKKVLKPHSPFTKIVFNFPHVGGLSTDVNRQVRANQQLLVDFFNSAKPLLATKSAPAKAPETHEDEGQSDYDSDSNDRQAEYLKHGQILVTLFEGEPYTLWNIRDLARHSGLKILESFKFPWTAYPGYHHARTIGDITTGKDRTDEGKRKGAWRGEERDARCYILALKDDDDGRPSPGSRKRKQQDNDDND